MRPIICICNDQYAPVLRPLRAVAQIYVIKPPNSHDLAKRLLDICTRENLKADLRSILLLVDLVEGDMRSAINSLQFMKTKASSITPELVRNTCIGVKDMQKGLFPVFLLTYSRFGIQYLKFLPERNQKKGRLKC